MKMYLLIRCHEDGDEYQTFSDIKEAKKCFKEGKKKRPTYYHTMVLCEIGPDQSFSFSDYGFQGADVIDEWSKYDQ